MGFFRRTFRFIAHVDHLLLTVMAVVATAPFSTLFASRLYLAFAVGAAAIALVVAALVPRRVPVIVALVAATAALAGYLVFAVFHVGVPLLEDLGPVWTGVSSSWHETLATSLPAVSTPTLLSLPVILAWGAAFVGLELASRTKLVTAVIVPSLGIFVVGLLLTGQRPGQSVLAPITLLAASLAVVLVRMNPAASASLSPQPGANIRATMAPGTTPAKVPSHLRVGVPVLVGVTVLGVLAGTVLPLVHDEDRVDLREQYEPPLDNLDGVTPLEPLSADLNDPTNPLLFKIKLDVIGTDPASIDRVRIASLDRYDGAVWSSSAHLTRVGDELPSGPPPPARSATVTENVTLADGYRSDFLPAFDRPTAISGDGLVFDRVSGMVVVPTGPVTGFRYTVTSAVPELDDGQLKAAPAGNDPSVADLALLPTDADIPPVITDYADQPELSKATPFETLKAIESDFRSNHFGFDKKSTPGHSLAVLRAFLKVPTDDQTKETNRTGDAEQFAAAFALVARIKGFASRVVVGYRLDPKKVALDQDIEVHRNDIHAWAEVNLRGVGWVPFDGMNPDNTNPVVAPPPTAPPIAEPNPSTPKPSATVAPTPVTPGCDVLASADCGTDETVVVWWPLVPLALVVITPILIVAAKRLRRYRRRRRGAPARRVVGAWRETTDRFSTLGMPTSRSMTPRELVDSYGPVAGDESSQRLREFVPVLDVTLYDEHEPEEHLVEQAWNAEAGVADALKGTAGRLKRARAAVDPRPLVRR